MYEIKVQHTIETTPWKATLEERIAFIKRYAKEGYKISLIIYRYPDTSTFRYRGYNIAQALEDSKRWKCVYFFRHEIPAIYSLLNFIHLITIVRVQWTHELDDFIFRAKVKGIKVLFDTDDLIYNLDYLPLVTNTLNVSFSDERDYEFWFAHIARLGYTASKADGFIVTNDYLGKKITNKFDKKYGVIPNFINNQQLEISRLCRQKKKVNKKPFTIGYFSGTPSHINDFKVVYREIAQLINEYKDIQLSVVGFMEFPKEAEIFIKTGRITFAPLVDFVELQRLMARVDVNIAPLVENTFTNCKSELKFFEAAIVDTISCVTPTEVYKKCIVQGETGFLCGQGQWYDTIKSIYIGNVDCSKIQRAAYDYALENYTGDRIVRKIEETYDMFYGE